MALTGAGIVKAIFGKMDDVINGSVVNAHLTGSNVLYDGTKSIGSTAEELGSDQDVLELMIQADPDNTEDIFVGNATSQSVKLKPGQSYEMSMANLNLVYVKADSGTQTVNYHARGES